jgi:quercetin dioxygenase-like cupin family protein
MTKKLFAIAAVTLLGGSAIAAQPMQGSVPGVSRTDLQRHDLGAAGYEALQARVDIAPGITSPWHTHPGGEIIYVLEGSLEYQLKGQQPQIYKPGEVLFVPAGVPHKATNVGTGNGAELATYVVQKGKPLLTLVK